MTRAVGELEQHQLRVAQAPAARGLGLLATTVVATISWSNSQRMVSISWITESVIDHVAGERVGHARRCGATMCSEQRLADAAVVHRGLDRRGRPGRSGA